VPCFPFIERSIIDKSQLTEFREMLITIRDKVSALKKQGKSLDVVGSFLRL